MIKNLSYVSLSFFYVNIVGFFFHFFSSRILSPSGYGEMIVLYSFMLSVGNIANIFTNITVKTIVENFNFKLNILQFLRYVAIFIGLLFSFFGILISPYLKKFLHISDVNLIKIVAITWCFMFLVSVERGFLQANNCFGKSAFSNVLEHSLRVLIAIILLLNGYRIFGAIFPSFLSIVTISIILLIINKNFLVKVQKVSLKYLLKIALYSSPAGFFIYIDDIFIKKTFLPEVAGFYASASILGKALMWFSLILFSVFFPKLVENKKNPKNLIKNIVLLNTLLFLIVETGIYLIGKKFFILLFGQSFIKGFNILPYYIIAIFPLTLCINFVGISTALEKNLKIIYLHLLLYTVGFIVIPFKGIFSYMAYIFLLNFVFAIQNIITFLI